MAHPPPLPPRLQLLERDIDDTEPGIGIPTRPLARNELRPPPLPAGRPRITDPVTIPSPFPPGSLPRPKPRRALWLAIGAAVLSVGTEIARIWYPSLISPLEALREGASLLQ